MTHDAQTQTFLNLLTVPARDKMIFVLAARTLKVYETNIHATANTATDDYAITLPPVVEARGLTFKFHVTIANTKTVTIVSNHDDYSDAEDWTDLDMDADNDTASVTSDGSKWHLNNAEIA